MIQVLGNRVVFTRSYWPGTRTSAAHWHLSSSPTISIRMNLIADARHPSGYWIFGDDIYFNQTYPSSFKLQVLSHLTDIRPLTVVALCGLIEQNPEHKEDWIETRKEIYITFFCLLTKFRFTSRPDTNSSDIVLSSSFRLYMIMMDRSRKVSHLSIFDSWCKLVWK